MQEMIERIVEMDKKARALTEQANELKLGAQKHIEQKTREIREDYLNRARKRLTIIKEEEEIELNEKIEQFQEKNARLSKALETEYNEKGESWADEIFARTIGGE